MKTALAPNTQTILASQAPAFTPTCGASGAGANRFIQSAVFPTSPTARSRTSTFALGPTTPNHHQRTGRVFHVPLALQHRSAPIWQVFQSTLPSRGSAPPASHCLPRAIHHKSGRCLQGRRRRTQHRPRRGTLHICRRCSQSSSAPHPHTNQPQFVPGSCRRDHAANAISAGGGKGAALSRHDGSCRRANPGGSGQQQDGAGGPRAQPAQ